MRVIMFQKQFVSRLLDGTKFSTIRAGDPVGFFKRYKEGTKVSLRYWEARPYGSPQIEFAQAEISAVSEVHIDLEEGAVLSGGRKASEAGCEALAKKDGFDSFQAMMEWFRTNHGKSGRHFFGACLTFRNVLPVPGVLR